MPRIIQEINVKVQMRDGVHLSCDIFRPAEGGPFPVMLSRSPYCINRPSEPMANAVFIKEMGKYQLAWVVQDCRGRFESDGVFDPFNESEDGYDTIEWIAKQSWCNGNVGMAGSSYPGFCVLDAAKTSPPHLKMAIAGVMGGDPFRDIIFSNGIFRNWIIDWGLGKGGRTNKPLSMLDRDEIDKMPLNKLPEICGFKNEFWQRMCEHTVEDSYWTKRSVGPLASKIKIPMFLMGSWFDPFAGGTYDLFDKLWSARIKQSDKKLKLIIGPWGHSMAAGRKFGDIDFGYDSVPDLAELRFRWINRYMKNEQNDIDKEPNIQLFVMGKNYWYKSDQWPLKNIKNSTLFLGSDNFANSLNGDGALSKTNSSVSEKDTYCYDPANPVDSASVTGLSAGMPSDQRPMQRRDEILVYDSDPMTDTLEIIGRPIMELYISSDAKDTDFACQLCDVYPDGHTIPLCHGIMRTRFREGLKQEILMEPGQIYKLRIILDPTANAFLPGHKIRLTVTSSRVSQYWRNTNTGGNCSADSAENWQTAQQTIYHSEQFPSQLMLPVVTSNQN